MASGRCMSKTVEYIQSKSQGINPTVGIILGSGLGSFVNVLENPISLSYDELDGFPDVGVSGHGGKLHLGKINHTEIAVLQGRAHYYETGRCGCHENSRSYVGRTWV